MITLNAALISALARGRGVIIARLHYSDSGGTARTPNILAYEFDRLTARVSIAYNASQLISRDAAFTISRGLEISGTEYLVASHNFYCDKTFLDPATNTYTILGHVLPGAALSLTNTDRAASLVITDLLAQVSITPVFDVGADTWYTWQMYPYNTPVNLPGARHLLDVISRKYLSDVLPRADGLHFGHRGTWSGGDTIADYTPTLKIISNPVTSQALYASWEDVRGNRYFIGNSNDAPHYLGFVDCNLGSGDFGPGAVASADIQSLATLYYGGDEFEQRPDLSLENGDTLTPPAGSAFLGCACIELEESFLRQAGSPRWIQRVKPINNSQQTKAAALQSHSKSTVYIRQPIYITRTIYAGDNPADDESYNTNSTASQADRISGDEATLMQRFLPQAYQIHHFNSYNQDFAWANTPLTTPRFSHSIYRSSIYIDSKTADRSFLWKVFDTDALSMFLLAHFFERTSLAEWGLRLDDGSDDNYVELIRTASYYKSRTRLGGAAASTSTLDTISDDYIVALRRNSASWTNFKVDYLIFRPFSGPSLNVINLGTSITLTFTPQRFGLFTSGAGKITADAIGYIDLSNRTPLPEYELVDHNHNPLIDHEETQLSGYQL